MQDAKILLVASNGVIKRHLTRALASTGCEITDLPYDQEILGQVRKTPQDLYILDADGDPDTVRWFAKELGKLKKDANLLLISQDFENQLILDLVSQSNLNNVIAKHGAVASFRNMIDEHELIVTCNKLILREIFGLDKYLSTWGIKIHQRQLTPSPDRDESLREIESFLEKLGCHRASVPSILMVADELLMNGIYNAPTDSDDNHKYAKTSRSELIELASNEHVNLKYACDGQYFAIAVTDQFGSLHRDVVVQYLRDSLSGGQAEVSEKKGGAGVGLHMVARSATQLIFNIQPGKRTEVIALFYIRGGTKGLRQSGRSLHVFFS